MTQFELSADGAGVTALVSCTETVDEHNNSSQLAITVEIKSRSWYGVTYWLEGTVGDSVLDKTVHYAYLGALNKYYPVEHTFYMRVPHEADGTGTAAVTVNIRGTTRTGSAGSGWRIQGSHTVTLTPIARASTVGATDAHIGAVSMIAVSRKNSSYTHTLQYTFGSLTGFIAEDGSVSTEPVYCTAAAIAFKLPQDFYYELTDAPSGVCAISCATYSGQTQVGVSAQCGFTVTAPEGQCAPVLTAQVVDVNERTLALTGDPGVMVRFCSQVQKTSTAQGSFGATILDKSMDGVIDSPESNSFSFYALDSRGYRSSAVLTMPMIPYVLLTANLSCSRDGSTANTATLTVRGNCFNGSFGLASNALTLTAVVGSRAYVLEPRFSGDSYTATCTLEDLSYTESHLITVEAADLLSLATAQVRLQQGVPVFDWGKNDFAFHVPVTAPAFNGITNVAFKAWPVGAVIMTADDRSPAQTIGGKWQRLEGLGIDLNLWQRLQSADLLGTGKLGSFILAQES